MNKKIQSCFKKVRSQGFDSILISNPKNISYLTGFREAEGYLLITHDNLFYFSNPLYLQEAKAVKCWKIIYRFNNIFDSVVKTAVKNKLENVAFEGKDIKFLEYKYLKERFLKKHIRFSETVDLVKSVRMIKTKDEIRKIEKAVNITAQAINYAKEIVNDNFSEKDLAVELERFLKIKGDDETAFKTIVACGKNSANPHHLPANTKLNVNNPILIDIGGRFNGFCADLTRVVFLGKMPHSLKKLHEIVKKAQFLAIKKIRAGVKISEVDLAARRFIENKGFGKFFTHGLGHGVGMDVHELPFVNKHQNGTLKEGMVITVEPAVYLPGKWGIRIEDIILVKSKKAEVLSGFLDR